MNPQEAADQMMETLSAAGIEANRAQVRIVTRANKPRSRIPGVYALLQEGRIAYIGGSGHTGRRVRYNRIEYDQAVIVPVPQPVRVAETVLLRAFQPPGNRTLTSNTPYRPPTPVEKLMDKADVAEQLGLSVNCVNHLVRTGKLPCLRIGRIVRFMRSAIVQAMEVAR